MYPAKLGLRAGRRVAVSATPLSTLAHPSASSNSLRYDCSFRKDARVFETWGMQRRFVADKTNESKYEGLGVKARYEAMLQNGDISEDPRQVVIINELDRF